jgi:rare lipoprotein A
MNSALLQRQAALAGVALLGAALAVGGSGDGGEAAVETPIARRVTWEAAQVSTFGAERFGRQTVCGITLTPETVGVAHPVLPCGVELVLAHEGREVRAEIVERGSVGQGNAFELTPALAEELEVSGTQTIRWRFAD